MALEGSLIDVSLADICQLLAMGRKSGCLTVMDEGNLGYVYFKSGRVIQAMVLTRPDRLGDLLVASGDVKREDLNEALAAQGTNPSKLLGDLLLEMEAVTEEALEACLRNQVEESIYHLFSWTHGSFHFNPDQELDRDKPQVSMNAEGLLLEGARRVDEWSQIEKKIPTFDLIMAPVANPPESDEELTKDQERLFGLLDGERTVADLVKIGGMLDFDTAKVLFGLLQAGYIERVGKRVEEDIPEGTEAEARQHLKMARAFHRAGMVEDSQRELEMSVSAHPLPQAHEFLGMVRLRRSEFEEALEQFERITEEADRSYGFCRNFSLALERLGRFSDALDCLEAADRLRPGDAGLSLARALVQLKSGDASAADQSFDQYRRLIGDAQPPELFYAYSVLAVALAGDVDRALFRGREGLQIYPECGALLVNTGAVLQRAGEEDAAVGYFLRSLKLKNPPPQAHKALGDLAYERGDIAGARAHYERAIKLDPELGDDVYVKLGDIARREDDPGFAELLWQRALEINPENKVAVSYLEKQKAVSAR